MANVQNESVVNIIQEVIETVCDKYCKYPDQYYGKYDTETDAEEHLYKECCDNCILNKLF